MANDIVKINISGLTAIVKPTTECNLDCKYCYVDEHQGKTRMSEQTLKKIISETIEYNEELGRQTRFLWHGGEPLLMDVDFWNSVVDFQKNYETKYKIRNGVQTNLTLLNEKEIKFFKDHDFAVSTSLDGPREIHNKNRIFKNGKGTYDKVIENIRILKSNNMQVGLVVVLNEESAPYIEDIYNLMKSEGLSFSINPISPVSRAENNDTFIKPVTFGNAMVKLLDLWLNEKDRQCAEKSRCNYAELVFEKLILGFSRKCAHSGNCSKSFVGFNYNGDVYPCGTLNGKEAFKYGNINENNLKNILHCSMRYSLMNRAQNVKNGECVTCEWNPVCNSGCMSHSYAKTGDVYSKDPFCAAYKIINAYAKEKLDEILVKAEASSDKDNCHVIMNKRVNFDKIENPAIAKLLVTDKIYSRVLPKLEHGKPSVIIRPDVIVNYPDYGDFYDDWREYMEYIEYDDYYMVYEDCLVLS